MYLARRYLGIHAHEWNRLPWWEQQLYVEGLAEEKPHVSRTVMLQKVDDPLKRAFFDSLVATEQEDADQFLTQHGFKIQNV